MSMVVVVVLCAQIIDVIYNTRRSAHKLGTATGRSNKSATYMWLILQSLCCIMSWLPIQICLVLSLCGFEISPEYVAWLMVILTNANALVNPVMYTLKNINFKFNS